MIVPNHKVESLVIKTPETATSFGTCKSKIKSPVTEASETPSPPGTAVKNPRAPEKQKIKEKEKTVRIENLTPRRKKTRLPLIIVEPHEIVESKIKGRRAPYESIAFEEEYKLSK